MAIKKERTFEFGITKMKSQYNKKNILVAPLHWGLGHATRCIPIIEALIESGFDVLIASDGNALLLLQKEFPKLQFLELPSYTISYSKTGSDFKWKILFQLPKIARAIYKENKVLKQIISNYNIDGIISDNRLGLFSSKVPSVFITHQLTLLTGNTTWFSSKIHRFFIEKFSQCWIPDVSGIPNLSGDLGRSKMNFKNKIYIGPLSRFKKNTNIQQEQILVILSGPEPQRTLLEEKLVIKLAGLPKKILFVKGILEENQHIKTENNITFYNFMTTEELEIAINESDFVICRSGYTSVMDLAILNKKAFFIPTPGQFEQNYLAKKFETEKRIPYCLQDEFTASKLEEIENYSGFSNFEMNPDWNKLFSLF